MISLKLSSNYIKVLKILSLHKELRVRDMYGFSESLLYKMLRDLAEDGLVKVRMGEGIKWKRRRVKWFSLTEEGRKLLELFKVSV